MTGLVELDVGLALDAAVLVPVRLAMPDEPDFRVLSSHAVNHETDCLSTVQPCRKTGSHFSGCTTRLAMPDEPDFRVLSSHAVNHETDCLSTVQLAGKPVPTFPVAQPVSPCLTNQISGYCPVMR
jgi:hypothetical protein